MTLRNWADFLGGGSKLVWRDWVGFRARSGGLAVYDLATLASSLHHHLPTDPMCVAHSVGEQSVSVFQCLGG